MMTSIVTESRIAALEDLCTSIDGTPEPDGNLEMFGSDSSGASFNRRCQIALPERPPIRRIDIDPKNA